MLVKSIFLLSQLEKSREAVDAANIRAEYAELMSDVLTDVDTSEKTYEVDLKQTQDGWTTTFDWPDGVTVPTFAKVNTKATLTYDSTNGVTVTIK